MVGYIVQAHSVQKVSKAQASLEREAAEREKVETKAGKQLERAQLHMAEWALVMANSQVYWGWVAIAKQLRLEAYIEMYSMEWFPQPATPHVDIFGSLTNPAVYVAMGGAMGHKVIRYTLFHLEADRPPTDHRHTTDIPHFSSSADQ